MSADPAAMAAGPVTPRRRPRRRWLRRLAWMLGLGLAARLLLQLLLPWLLQWGVAGLGLHAEYRSLSLSLLTLDLRLDGLVVRAQDAPGTTPPLLSVDHVAVDVSLRALLDGTLRVEDLTVAGLSIAVERDASGRLVLPAALSGGDTTASEPQAEPSAASPDQQVRFKLPVQIRTTRLADVRLSVRDPALPAPGELLVVGDLHAREIGTGEQPGAIELRLMSPQCLDLLHLQAQVLATDARGGIDCSLDVRGFRPDAVAAWLLAAGLRPMATRYDLHIGSTLQARRHATEPDTAALDATLEAAIQADAETVLRLEQLRLSSAGLRPGRPPLPTELGVQALELSWPPRGSLAEGELPLHVLLPELQVGPTAVDGNRTTVPFAAKLALPELLGALALRQGRIELAGAEGSLQCELDGGDITLSRLRPHLAQAGMESTFTEGRTTGSLRATLRRPATGETRIDATLRDLVIADGERSFALPLVQLDELVLAADGNRLDARSLVIEGPKAMLSRDAGRVLSTVGFRLAAPETPPRPATAPPRAAPRTTTGPGTSPTSPFGARLRELRWHGAEIHLVDESVQPNATLMLQQLDIEGRDLGFGPGSSDPGTLELTARVPDLVEELRILTTLTPRPDGASASLELDARELTLVAVRSYLAQLGLEPRLERGMLSLRAEASVQRRDDQLHAAAAVRDVLLQDDEEVLLHCDRIEVAELVASPRGLDLGRIRVLQPMLALQRCSTGLQVLGCRPLVTPLADPGSDADPAPDRRTTEPTAPSARSQATALRLGGLQVQQARLRWRDEALPAVAPADLTADVQLAATIVGSGAEPAEFTVALQSIDCIDALQLRGTLRADPGAFAVDVTLDGSGLRSGPLFRYLPPGIEVLLQDGQLRGMASVQTGPVEGGARLRAEVRELSLRDGEREWLSIPQVLVDLPRIAADGAAVDIAAIRIADLRGVCERQGDALSLLGLRLGPGGGDVPQRDAPAARPQPAPLVLPQLQIQELDLRLAEWAFVDRTTPDAMPLRLSTSLQLEQPWLVDANDLANAPPAKLLLRGSADPLCREIELDLGVRPFAVEPHLEVTAALRGIDTTTLTRIVPELQSRLAGGATNDHLTARIEVDLKKRRRRLDEFDLHTPFGADIVVSDLALRDGPDGQVWCGIDGIEIDVRSFDPPTGTVHVRELELRNPQLRLEQTATGLRFAGLTLLRQPEEPAANPAIEPPAESQRADAPTFDFSADQILVQDLDLRYVDQTTTPPTVLPVEGLDLAVQGFSTRVLREALPFSFSASVRGGLIELDRRLVHSSVFTGILSSTAKIVTGGQPRREQRPLFDELAVQGQLQVFPIPLGNVRASLRGFELPALHGLAQPSGVVIGDGLADLGVDVAMLPGNRTEVELRSVFTWLSLSEPPGGPISTYLRLPAPLDTVLFLLRNENDEQRIQLRFAVDSGRIGAGAIGNAAAEAFALLVADAVYKAPLRATSVVTGLLGLFGLGGSPENLADRITAVEFPAGSAALPELDTQATALVDLAVSDPQITLVLTHELGVRDLESLAPRVNPGPPDVLAHALHLRDVRAGLVAERDRLAGIVRGLFTTGQTIDANRTLKELQGLDRRLGELEQAWIETLRRLRPGTTRAGDRNTRQAGIELAALRLEALRTALLRRLGPQRAGQLDVRPARFAQNADTSGPGRVIVAPRRRT